MIIIIQWAYVNFQGSMQKRGKFQRGHGKIDWKSRGVNSKTIGILTQHGSYNFFWKSPIIIMIVFLQRFFLFRFLISFKNESKSYILWIQVLKILYKYKKKLTR